MTLPILIVDDQAPVVQALEVLLDVHDIPHRSASSPDEACAIAASETLGAVLQDMNFSPSETSGHEGVELFRALRSVDADLPILLMTAWASLEAAVELVREGAADYIEKPWNDERLLASLSNLIRIRTAEIDNRRLREELLRAKAKMETKADLCGMVYESGSMHRAISLAVSVARSDAPVMITGGSGCGKERIAEIIQANSPRRNRPFLRVNVGAIPTELMEAELFGAEAGAYTGISSRRIGHFESAHGGTLFLDEVDALSLAGQVKLLRVLANGDFQRLGSSRSLTSDVRVISATNARLPEIIADGGFREDLFYRLNVVEVAVPALAARRDDILPLARHFLELFTEETTGAVHCLSAAAEEALLDHPWPGNVRELENRIRRATVVTAGSEIVPEDLDLGDATETAQPPPSSAAEAEERRALLDALSRCEGVVAHAAAELGISRQAMYRRMARLGVAVERRARGASWSP